MFKIMILRRAGSDPLYTPFLVEDEENPSKKIQYQTNSKNELIDKIRELQNYHPDNDIIAYHDLSYITEIILKKPDFCAADCEWAFDGESDDGDDGEPEEPELEEPEPELEPEEPEDPEYP